MNGLMDQWINEYITNELKDEEMNELINGFID